MGKPFLLWQLNRRKSTLPEKKRKKYQYRLTIIIWGQQKDSYENRRNERFESRGELSVSSRRALTSQPAARACWDSTQRWSQAFSHPPKMSLISLVWLLFFFFRIASDFSLCDFAVSKSVPGLLDRGYELMSRGSDSVTFVISSALRSCFIHHWCNR